MSIAPSATLAGDSRVLLHNISWRTYEVLRDDAGNRSVRLTYDDGDLELMSPSRRHERFKDVLVRLIGAISFEFNIPICSGGSTTHRREDLRKGFEPDASYYVQNEPRMRGRFDLDLSVDPPPDLAVEVEITRSALDRLVLYAALGVPEVWRWDGQTLRVCLLEAGDRYTESADSRAFPFLPISEVTRALHAIESTDENSLIRDFLSRVRARMEGKS